MGAAGLGQAQGFELYAELRSANEQAAGNFGWAVASAGDLNGDGRADVVVGAPYEDDKRTGLDVGGAYAFWMGSYPRRYTAVSPSKQASGSFGYDVAGVGDVNGDGFDDVVVGARGEDELRSPLAAGRAHVYSGVDGVVLYTLRPSVEEREGQFGWSVAGAGDVNGDGFADVIVGAPAPVIGTPPDPDVGRAFVFSGRDGSELHAFGSPNFETYGNFGYDVAGVGDVNGDGFDDAAVGAIFEDLDPTRREAGRVYVFSGADGQLIHTLASPNAVEDGQFGTSIAGVGDLNGDGSADVLVGAPRESLVGSPSQAGRAYAFNGADAALLYELGSPSENAASLFGTAVANAGDVNDDGVPDLLVGAPGDDVGALLRAGRAHVFSGADGHPMHALVSPNLGAFGSFGSAVAGAGDVDGDGRPDLLVGTWVETSGNSPRQAGRAYVFSQPPAPERSLHLLTCFAGSCPDAVEAEDTVPFEVPSEAQFTAHPNPFNPTSQIAIRLEEPADVSFTMYDAAGRVVGVLHEGALEAGAHTFTFDGRTLASGSYFAVLRAGTDVSVQRMVLLK